MKNIQSYSELENKLKDEKVPFKDHKSDIINNLNRKKNTGLYITRKAMIICFTVLLFISITTVAIATKGFGFLSVKTEILTTLYDTEGNLVYEIGIMKSDNKEEYGKHQIKQSNQRKNFENLYNSIEKDLPDDKVAFVIPVKNLDEFTDIIELLNIDDTYKSIIDMTNAGVYIPTPEYIPNGYTFHKSHIFYNHEQIKDFANIDLIVQAFNETKAQGKDYYYKEYDRTDINSVHLTYKNDKGRTLSVSIQKGKGCSITGPVTIVTTSSGTTKYQNTYSFIKKYKYNKREYAVDYATEDHPTYYSYFYRDNQLWNIDIFSHTSVEAEDIMKIVESMSN